jgi:hypothetical protein
MTFDYVLVLLLFIILLIVIDVCTDEDEDSLHQILKNKCKNAKKKQAKSAKTPKKSN